MKGNCEYVNKDWGVMQRTPLHAAVFAAIQDEKAQTKEEKRLEVTRAQDIGGKVPCVGSSENAEVASSLAPTNFMTGMASKFV